MDTGPRSGAHLGFQQPLRAVLIADQKPLRCKVIALDKKRIEVLLKEQLIVDGLHLMRITLDDGIQQRDLALRIEQVHSGQDTLYKWGWLHHGTHRDLSPEESELLTTQIGSTDFSRSQTTTGEPTPTRSEPVSADTSGMARRSGRARVVRAMARSTRKQREDTARKAAQKNPQVGNRRDSLLERVQKPSVPRKGVPESLLATPLYIPGPPVGLLAVFPNAQAAAAALDFDESGVCVVLRTCSSLEVGDVVDLVLEFPDKTQVHLMTMVLRKGNERDYLKANFIDPDTLALLTRRV